MLVEFAALRVWHAVLSALLSMLKDLGNGSVKIGTFAPAIKWHKNGFFKRV